MLQVHFIQTADNLRYRQLLEISSQTVIAYCSKNGFTSEIFFGVMRGYYPWHAAYNRILMLNNLYARGYRGWVCYLDADAYIVDQSFDLKSILDSKSDILIIAAPVSNEADWWRVNSGVFFVNFDHGLSSQFVASLSSMFMSISEESLAAARNWDDIRDDQNMLQHALFGLPGGSANVHIVRGPPNLINYSDGLFIRQLLRATGTLEKRIETMRIAVDSILPRRSRALTRSEAQSDLLEDFPTFLYRLFLQREPDQRGRASMVAALQRGDNLELIMKRILGSEEFLSKREEFFNSIRGYSTRP